MIRPRPLSPWWVTMRSGLIHQVMARSEAHALESAAELCRRPDAPVSAVREEEW
jgi:hypothetical protein